MKIIPFPEVEDIHAIPIPFPNFPDLITANVYMIGKGPVTLIDTGPKTPAALAFIRREMRSAGFEMADVERIIMTHGHSDHFGLAASIRREAGHPIDCFIHGEDKWRVISAEFQTVWNSREAEELRAMVGMPLEKVEKMRARSKRFREMFDPIEDVRTMSDGEEFMGRGYHLRVIHTPGHCPGSCCIYEVGKKILFSGDHLIKHVTPNPLYEIKRDRLPDPEYQSLKAYFESLGKLSGLGVHSVFPGHGEYIDDLEGILQSFKIHHRERMDLLWKAIRKRIRPLYDYIGDVFPFVPEDDLFLAVSEIIVHLEILINEGRAELVTTGPPALYRAL